MCVCKKLLKILKKELLNTKKELFNREIEYVIIGLVLTGENELYRYCLIGGKTKYEKCVNLWYGENI